MFNETDETSNPFGYYPDLFAEPHDHANLWDVSAFWDIEDECPDSETPVQPVSE